MRERNIRLARRLSGGGAVYHDEGNLNYAFFMPRERYRDAAIYDAILRALSLLNIRAARMNRNSLAVDGLKISGNAFCFRRNAAMHHGTLLVSADLDHLKQALSPWRGVIHTKAVASIRSPVTNLCALDPRITLTRVQTALVTVCGGWDEHRAGMLPDAREVDRVVARYRSDEWLYGQTPAFDVEWDDARFTVEKGRVVAVGVRDPAREATLTRAWMGKRFDIQAVSLKPETRSTTGT